MNTHTPGPWKAHTNNTSEYIDIDAGPQRICSILADTGDAECDAENIANAALIAAAPDMFEALQRMYDEYYTEGYDPQSPLGQAFAAIQKARGESV